jgi:hypothetical protein
MSNKIYKVHSFEIVMHCKSGGACVATLLRSIHGKSFEHAIEMVRRANAFDELNAQRNTLVKLLKAVVYDKSEQQDYLYFGDPAMQEARIFLQQLGEIREVEDGNN